MFGLKIYALKDFELSGEGPLEGRACFAAGDIGNEVRVFAQQTESIQPAQHSYHEEVVGDESAVEPVGIGKATRKLAQPLTDAILNGMQALLVPGLFCLKKRGHYALDNRWLDRVERGKHPCDGARSGIDIGGHRPAWRCAI